MKAYTRFMLISLFAFIALAFAANLMLFTAFDSEESRLHNIEINRLMESLDGQVSVAAIDLADYPSIAGIQFLPFDSSAEEARGFLESSDITAIRIFEGKDGQESYIKFNLNSQLDDEQFKALAALNGVLMLVMFFILAVLLYVRAQIIAPFDTFSKMPQELAKGQLERPLKAQKNRYFGGFLWGLDMLREELKSQKQRSQELEKERKTFTLSLAHDIKTPLSAIKLYIKALREGLYSTPEKQQETLANIEQKSNQIEEYLGGLIKATTEDFLDTEVINSEFYLADLAERLKAEYTETCELLQVELVCGSYENVLLMGDEDRALEALENAMENALKYGDGRAIELSFEREDTSLLITVSNMGCTLPQQELVHVFDSFWRGSNSQGKSGNGLGLSIVRKIMSQMGGDASFSIIDNKALLTILLRVASNP